MRTRREICESLLGYSLDEQGRGPCPACHCHTTPSSNTDWRIWFDGTADGMPHDSCYHQSCLAERIDFMKKLWSAIWKEEHPGGYAEQRPKWAPKPLPAAPTAPAAPKRSELNTELAEHVAELGAANASDKFLLDRSPVLIPDKPGEWPRLLLSSIYKPDDRILICTEYKSQGRLLYIPRKGLFALGDRQGVQARPCDVWPRGGRCGVWFLNSPISGAWKPADGGKYRTDPETGKPLGKLSRRVTACCTSFPYLVLESDELPDETWYRLVSWFQMPIVAVYTSGGKSIHCLVKIGANSAETFKALTAPHIRLLSSIGADPAAMTPVRLTRLPGCLRFGKEKRDGTYEPYPEPRMQRLLYLNPYADGTPIMDMPALRDTVVTK